MTSELLHAGRVGRPHGLDGSFHVVEPAPRLLSLGALDLGGGARDRGARAARAPTHGRSSASAWRRTATEVEALRGEPLRAPRDAAPAARGRRVLGRRPRRLPGRRRRARARRGAAAARACRRARLLELDGGQLVPMVQRRDRAVDVAGAAHRGGRALPGPGRRAEACSSTSSRCSPSGSTGSAPSATSATRSRHGHELRTLDPRAAHAADRRAGRRHAVRRRRGDGPARRRHGRRAARRSTAPIRSSCASSGASSRSSRAAGCSTTASSTSSPRRRRSRCCAGATRASTSGSCSTSRRTRCRSAATCCPAASWRRWWSPTRCCASCRARSGTRTARWRSRSPSRSRGGPEYPHYTRPAEYRGWKVPDVLLSGHHAEIGTWRRARSQELGRASRPSGLRRADLRYHGRPALSGNSVMLPHRPAGADRRRHRSPRTDQL